MVTPTKRVTLAFNHPFSLKDVDRCVAPCRAATMILLPTDSRWSSVEMVTVEPTDLAAAHERDSMVSSPVISTTNPRAP